MSIEKHGNRYRIRVTRNGKRHVEIADTKAEAIAIEKALKAGTGKRGSHMTVTEAWGRYMDFLEYDPSKEARAGTLGNYRRALRDYVVGRIGDVRLAELEGDDIESWQREQRRAGLALGTVRRHRSHLMAVLHHAERKGWIEAVPPSVAPKVDPRAIETLTDDERELLLKHLHGRVLYGPAFLALRTGLRRGEALGLKWTDLTLDARPHLRVQRQLLATAGWPQEGPPKTKSSCRVVPLDPAAVTWLTTHRREQMERRLVCGSAWIDEGWVFDRGDGGPYHPGQVSNDLRGACERAGIRRVNFHLLRHTFGTWAEPRIPLKTLSQILGHANVEITANLYQHPDEQARYDALVAAFTL